VGLAGRGAHQLYSQVLCLFTELLTDSFGHEQFGFCALQPEMQAVSLHHQLAVPPIHNLQLPYPSLSFAQAVVESSHFGMVERAGEGWIMHPIGICCWAGYP